MDTGATFTVRTLTEDCEIEAEHGFWRGELDQTSHVELQAWDMFDKYIIVAKNNAEEFGWISTVQFIGSDDTVIYESRIEAESL